MHGSTLANAVVMVTANTLNFTRALTRIVGLMTAGMARMAGVSAAGSLRIMQAFSLINVAIAASTAGIVSLVLAFTRLASAGGGLEAAEKNVAEVFGRSTAVITAAAEEQAAMFGRSKSEYLSYAAEIGRGLEMLGVREEAATGLTKDFLAAVSRLAESRRISFGEAFAEARSGRDYTEEQLRAYAWEHKLISNRNGALHKGAEEIARMGLEIERINATTTATAGATQNWSSQVNALGGNFANLAETIGKDIEPVFVAFFEQINAWLVAIRQKWAEWREDIWTTAKALAPILGLLEGVGANAQADLAAIDQRNAAGAAQAGQRQAVGAAIGRGGGGGGGGFQGGLADFARRIQQGAFSQAQVAIQRRQLAAAEATAEGMRQLIRMQPWKDPERAGKNDAPWF